VRETNALAEMSVHRMIFTSSGAIYRLTKSDQRVDEDADPENAQRKYFGERCFLGNVGTALRLINLMGEGMSDETIIPDILKQVSTIKDMETVFRDCSVFIDWRLGKSIEAAIPKFIPHPATS